MDNFISSALRSSPAWLLPAALSRPMIVAHRGARSYAPENTLAAARLGHAQHADAWELDVNLTLDGQLVVIHDDTLARTTDVHNHPELAALKPWRVCDLTLAQIRSLDAGGWFAQQHSFPNFPLSDVSAEQAAASYIGQQVPTLAEALALTRDLGWLVNVEIKNHAHLRGHNRITTLVLDLVRSMGMGQQVLLSSFQHEYLREAHALMPGLMLGALVETLPPQRSIDLCREVGATFYHPLGTLVTVEESAALREAGLGLMPWTINRARDMDALLLAGASGLITDFVPLGLERLEHILLAKAQAPGL